MKKFATVLAMVFALGLFVGCAEEPEERMVPADDTMYTDPMTDTDPMYTDTMMTETMMEDPMMTDPMMTDPMMTDTTMTDPLDPPQ
jgi:pentapeptide MXKDX repeat protein